jgi:integrase
VYENQRRRFREGSVYRETVADWTVHREGQPSPWQARFRPPGGRTVSQSFKLEREAKTWRAERVAEYEAGQYVDPKAGGGTFQAYADGWLSRRNVKASSVQRDASYLRSLILPTFGERALNAVTADEIETWIVGLRNQGYAASTVRGASNIVATVFDDAVDRGKLARSPMPSKSRLRRVLPAAPKPSNPKTRFLTRAEFDKLAENIDPAYRAMTFVAAFGGLRWGETAALRPEDVDLERRQLAVHATLAQPVGGIPYRDLDMKTDASSRTIALGGVADVLAEHIETHASSDWLFPASSGGPLRADNWIRSVWKPATKAAGLTPPPLRFHDLRHTCAAWLIKQGESVLVIQKRLGHSKPSTTLNIYGHLFPGVDEAAAEELTAGIGAANS